MTEIPLWVPVVSALAGGGLVGIINFATNWQNRKSEEKRHLRELMFNAAIENWKEERKTLMELRKEGRPVIIAPLDSYIIHMMNLTELLNDNDLNKDNLKYKLDKVIELSSETTAYLKARQKEKEEKKKEKENT